MKTPTKKPLDINQIFRLLHVGKAEFGFDVPRHGYVSKSDEEQSIPFIFAVRVGVLRNARWIGAVLWFVVIRLFCNPFKVYGAFELG